MKRVIIILLLSFTLTSCGQNKNEKQNVKTEKTENVLQKPELKKKSYKYETMTLKEVAPYQKKIEKKLKSMFRNPEYLFYLKSPADFKFYIRDKTGMYSINVSKSLEISNKKSITMPEIREIMRKTSKN